MEAHIPRASQESLIPRASQELLIPRPSQQLLIPRTSKDSLFVEANGLSEQRKSSNIEFSLLSLISNGRQSMLDQRGGGNFRQLVAKRQRQQDIQHINVVDISNHAHQELLIEILKDQNKTPKEMAFLLKVIAELPLFQKNPQLLSNQNSMGQLFQEFSYQFCHKNDVIFNSGDFGYTYYIIIRGSVYLLIPKLNKDDNRTEGKKNSNLKAGDDSTRNKSPKADDNQHFFAASPEQSNAPQKWGFLKQKIKQFIQRRSISKDSSFSGEFSSLNQQDDSVNQDEGEAALKKIYADMNLIKTFQSGEAFGEISLITKQRRTGTMVCKEDTHLITLTKTGFDKILGQYHEQLKTERLGFLKSFEFFNGIPNSNLLSILLDMKIEILPNKAILFNQKDAVNDVFFLKSGEVQLYKDVFISSESQNTEKRTDNEESCSIAPSANFFQKYHGKDKLGSPKKKPKCIKITALARGSHFGLEDLTILQAEQYQNSLNNRARFSRDTNQTNNMSSSNSSLLHSMTAEIVSEYAEVYSLNKNIFLNNLLQFKTLDTFYEIIKRKKQYFESREQLVVETCQKSCQSLIQLTGRRKGEGDSRSTLLRIDIHDSTFMNQSNLNNSSVHHSNSNQSPQNYTLSQLNVHSPCASNRSCYSPMAGGSSSGGMTPGSPSMMDSKYTQLLSDSLLISDNSAQTPKVAASSTPRQYSPFSHSSRARTPSCSSLFIPFDPKVHLVASPRQITRQQQQSQLLQQKQQAQQQQQQSDAGQTSKEFVRTRQSLARRSHDLFGQAIQNTYTSQQQKQQQQSLAEKIDLDSFSKRIRFLSENQKLQQRTQRQNSISRIIQAVEHNQTTLPQEIPSSNDSRGTEREGGNVNTNIYPVRVKFSANRHNRGEQTLRNTSNNNNCTSFQELQRKRPSESEIARIFKDRFSRQQRTIEVKEEIRQKQHTIQKLGSFTKKESNLLFFEKHSSNNISSPLNVDQFTSNNSKSIYGSPKLFRSGVISPKTCYGLAQGKDFFPKTERKQYSQDGKISENSPFSGSPVLLQQSTSGMMNSIFSLPNFEKQQFLKDFRQSKQKSVETDEQIYAFPVPINIKAIFKEDRQLTTKRNREKKKLKRKSESQDETQQNIENLQRILFEESKQQQQSILDQTEHPLPQIKIEDCQQSPLKMRLNREIADNNYANNKSSGNSSTNNISSRSSNSSTNIHTQKLKDSFSRKNISPGVAKMKLSSSSCFFQRKLQVNATQETNPFSMIRVSNAANVK